MRKPVILRLLLLLSLCLPIGFVSTLAGSAEPQPGKTAAVALVDINTAAEAQLRGLPGIGDAYSKKIVAGRPYANKTQLLSRNILPESVYKKIETLIIAKQPKP